MFISSYFQSPNSEPIFDVLRFEVFIKYCRSKHILFDVNPIIQTF